MATVESEKIKEAVRDAYGDIARRHVESPGGTGCCGQSQAEKRSPASAGCCDPPRTSAPGREQGGCCGPAQAAVEDAGGASRFYSDAELVGLPETVTEASLGCGNPTAIAELRPGEVVLDLGSGGGIDCFLAARQVGPEGRVIGLDMTPDMIKLARRNAKKLGVNNVDFRYGEMEEIPLSDASVDAIISNCVINLSPDKDAVFGEAYRVLRPGGRVSISDIVVDGDLPQPIRESLSAWAGCIAGALDESDYLGRIRAAGFETVEVYSREWVSLGGDAEWAEVERLLGGTELSPADLDHKVASIRVRATKTAL